LLLPVLCGGLSLVMVAKVGEVEGVTLVSASKPELAVGLLPDPPTGIVLITLPSVYSAPPLAVRDGFSSAQI